MVLPEAEGGYPLTVEVTVDKGRVLREGRLVRAAGVEQSAAGRRVIFK